MFAIIAIVLVAALLGFIAARPADFRISRSASMAVTPAIVFEQVNDLHKWNAWSPWARLDPNVKSVFDGPSSGPGCSLHWSSDSNQVGEGIMTITESRASEYIQLRLQFLRPFKAVNTTEFTFRGEGAHTLVTWTNSGKNNFMGKAMSLLMNCEKMVGAQFEKGLANLQALVETPR